MLIYTHVDVLYRHLLRVSSCDFILIDGILSITLPLNLIPIITSVSLINVIVIVYVVCY